MGMTAKTSRVWIVVAGVLGFSLLMELKDHLSGVVLRVSVGALAGPCLAVSLAWAAKIGRSVRLTDLPASHTKWGRDGTMGMTGKASRIGIAVVGVLGFSLLMVFRGDLSGVVLRVSVGALAALWLTVGLAWAAKVGR